MNGKEGKSIESVVNFDPGEKYGGWGPDRGFSSVRESDMKDDALRTNDADCLGCWLSRRAVGRAGSTVGGLPSFFALSL